MTILLRSLCLTLWNRLLLSLWWSFELHFHEFNWKLRWCTLAFHKLINRRLLWRRLSIYRFFNVSAEISQINWLLLRSIFFIRYLISIDVIISWSFWLILYTFCYWKLRSRTISINLSHLQLYFLKRFINFNRFFYLQKGRVVRHQSVVLFRWRLLWLLDIWLLKLIWFLWWLLRWHFNIDDTSRLFLMNLFILLLLSLIRMKNILVLMLFLSFILRRRLFFYHFHRLFVGVLWLWIVTNRSSLICSLKNIANEA